MGALDSTSQALSKLAQKLDDSAQRIRSLQAQAAAGITVTVGLVVLDVIQLGQDPVTDAATVGAGGADAYVPENMPPGVNNDVGKYWIQQIESKGIRVEWNLDAQLQLEQDEAYAGTYNYNAKGADSGDPNLVVVGLSPDATPAAVYGEYLHVEAAEARDWVPLGNTDAKLAEEIEVEYQVLQNAENLQMTSRITKS